MLDPVSLPPRRWYATAVAVLSTREEWRANLRLARFALYAQRVLLGLEVERILSRATLVPSGPRAKTRVCTEVLRILGVDHRRSGVVLGPANRPRLIVANHRTALDIGVLMAELGGAFLSRADVADWPIAGRLAQYAGTIFVDRTDKRSGARAIRAIRRRLRSGETVIVFPEGTTSAGDEVRAFQGGAFAALRGLDVDIVPVGLAYPQGTEFVESSFVGHIRGIAARPTTPMHIQVGAPFLAKANARKTAAHAHQIVQELVTGARNQLKRHNE